MEKYLSIRCIKIQAANAFVLLYKTIGGTGFSIMCEEFTHIEKELGFVKLTEVSFEVFSEEKRLMDEIGDRTVHAVAKGVLSIALPFQATISNKMTRFLESLPEIDYDPFGPGYFFYIKTKQPIETAKELYAYEQKVRVVV